MDELKYPDIICKALAKNFMSRRDAEKSMEKLRHFEKKGEGIAIEEILLQDGYLNIYQIQVLNYAEDKKRIANSIQATLDESARQTVKTQFTARSKLTTGSQIGPFTILRTLGKGGMGVVYLAKQDSPKREVALKIINKSVKPDSRQGKRFLREVELSAQLDNPYIIKVYTGGIENNIFYLAMLYVDGMPLDKYMEDTIDSITVSEKLEIINKVAKGLEYSHSKGIVHRDIKPSNIILTRDKTPKIMDFGLAKSNRVSKRLTQSGEILGTPAYMSPEQARGQRDIDLRTDIYSLGNILYEFVTGRMMYPGNNAMEVINRVAYHTPPLPRWVDETIPEEVEAIILKSIDKNPNKRYQTALEMSEDIERYLTGVKTRAGVIHSLLKNRWRLAIYRKRIISSLLVCSILFYVDYFFTYLPLHQRSRILMILIYLKNFHSK